MHLKVLGSICYPFFRTVIVAPLWVGPHRFSNTCQYDGTSPSAWKVGSKQLGNEDGGLSWRISRRQFRISITEAWLMLNLVILGVKVVWISDLLIISNMVDLYFGSSVSAVLLSFSAETLAHSAFPFGERVAQLLDLSSLKLNYKLFQSRRHPKPSTNPLRVPIRLG